MSFLGSGTTPCARSSPQDRAETAEPGAPLFVERRRKRPLEQAWHEALDRVHHLLVRYEEMNEQLSAAEEEQRRIIEACPLGIFRCGAQGELVLANAALARIFGYESTQAFADAVPAFDSRLFASAAVWPDAVERLRAVGGPLSVDAEVVARDGTCRWVRLNLNALHHADSLQYLQGTAEDISDQRRAQDAIRQLAFYDQVTGLPNRRLFEDSLREYLDDARLRGEGAALILLEVARFKEMNDSLGRAFGDHLLRSAAARIGSATCDGAIVARFYGAEFAILLPATGDPAGAGAAARRILAAVSAEIGYLEHVIQVTCSAGISLFPEDADDRDALLQQADAALSWCRERGPAEVCFFHAEMNARMRERLRVEEGLRQALNRGELFLVYQPQIDTRSGAICGLEALLRWRHPERGLVAPADFIGVAESCGLIVPIGEWVLGTACEQAMAWQRAGFPPVPIAVNVSAIQFRQQGFCEMVRSVLEETGLDPKYLELELTEGLLLTNADVVFGLIQELRTMGVKLTIDDFGTGYSSLGYLRQFKVNRLKIDRSFVRDIPVSADDAAITTAIIRMARALNLEVIAEGVENAEQLTFLRDQNCYEVQGFYFSKPIGVEEVSDRLRSSWPG